MSLDTKISLEAKPRSERGKNATPHTWVVFAIKDTWPIQVNGVACRVVPYDKLRMRLVDPTAVF